MLRNGKRPLATLTARNTFGHEITSLRYYAKDIFVMIRRNRPGVTRIIKQLHARKNHSYFLVFQLGATKAKLNSINVMRDLTDARVAELGFRDTESLEAKIPALALREAVAE